METSSAGLAARVRAQYEAYPYPAYGLFLPLRGQEAYASNSVFAARLMEQHGGEPALRRDPAPSVLLAGCGDVFPYLATFWEPRRHRLIALDLSAHSLRRARLRCLPRLRAIDWRRADLGDEAIPLPEKLTHADCYGVLHHMARPAAALARLGRSLAPGGTARLMVYNSPARAWIRHLQRAFSLLGLQGGKAEDRDAARALLRFLSEVSPALRARLSALGETLSHPARFVDTFFHAREARLDLAYWLQAIADAGLTPLGLYDRYGELDDLPNPLLEFPAETALRERIADRRFENNFEIFLAKMGSGPAEESGGRPYPRANAPSARIRLPSAHALRTPPRSWWGYRETCGLPWGLRRAAWKHFLANLSGHRVLADGWAGRLPPRALQRLGRLGAVWPDECGSEELKRLLREPLEDSMEPPGFAPASDLRGNRALRERVRNLLREAATGARREDRLNLVLARLDAAQRP
jgi:SAM-dependent methyltransferase